MAATSKPEKKPAVAVEELSDEDRQLKENIGLLVGRLKEGNISQHAATLSSLSELIRSSTTTMTSVPKPLKFLRPHFGELVTAFEALMDDGSNVKKQFADILSVMATTNEGSHDCLKYRLLGTGSGLDQWGHEYVRHLQGEIAEEYALRAEREDTNTEDLVALAAVIVPYCMRHNAEPEACDLLMEIERLDMLAPHVDEKSFQRVCLYLFSCVPYVAEPEDSILLQTCYDLYVRFSQWPLAMLIALRLGDEERINQVFIKADDRDMRRQLAFMLARQQRFVPIEDLALDIDSDEVTNLVGIMSNTRLSESFLSLARELDIMEPKLPEDIYKADSARPGVDSHRGNLASSFVNGFVNAGFGTDKLILTTNSKWIHKHKDSGFMSATASLGLLLLWDVDAGLSQIDAYIVSENDQIKAGALLAVGVVNASVRNDCDPALALLSDYTTHSTTCLRVGSCMGLGLAYAGSANQTVADLLLPVLEDLSVPEEAVAVAALALGQIFVGKADGTIAEALVSALLLREKLRSGHFARQLVLAIGLLFLGRQGEAEVTLATLATLPAPLNQFAATLVESCAYAGTGNVLKVQRLLQACSGSNEPAQETVEQIAAAAAAAATASASSGPSTAPLSSAAPAPSAKDKEKESEKQKEKEAKLKATDMNQAFSVLGVALIALGEEIGTEMVLRTFNHLLQYGTPSVRRAVPVALGLLCASNPVLTVLDTLSKLSHDSDAEVAYAAIFAMGLVGAGTNQARIAAMLRNLALFYAKDASALFMVRVAQGLLHTGKGSITLCPVHTERSLVSPTGLAGLLATLTAVMDSQNVLLRDGHYNLFHLALAMYPRILCTLDTDLKSVSTSVRVGQAVDVVAQAGQPRTITGFVTSTTPVLLGYGERAQLATEQYLSLTPLLEGFVLLRRNPEFTGTAAK